jgi:leucyl-tRNA synthetase
MVLGDLHMGHAEVMALHDVVARYWWQRGYEVLNPMGWDSFGLPAENAAIKRNEHPATYTYANIETQYESFKKYGISFDWSRRLHTSDPEYYRWTQWLFLKFFERGLAYRKEQAPVNWCPNDQTVLANEQVVDGRCERCGAEVDQARADAVVLQDHRLRRPSCSTTWTLLEGHLARARADRCSATGSAAPRAPRRLPRRGARRSSRSRSSRRGRTRCSARRSSSSAPSIRWPRAGRRRAATSVRGLRREAARDRHRAAVDRPAQDRRLPGASRVNPVNGERIPVWAADYVLADYGTGAIMAVPAHDQRDLDFAEVRPADPSVVDPPTDPATASRDHRGDGVATSTPAAGRLPQGRGEARDHRAGWPSAAPGEPPSTTGCATGCSRGSATGAAPIPIVHCEACGEVPVPDDQLPVLLPELSAPT